MRFFIFVFFCFFIVHGNAEKTCPVGLRVFLQDGGAASYNADCGAAFLEKVRAHEANAVTDEFELLPDRQEKDLVMGLLVLAKRGVSFDQPIDETEESVRTEIGKVTKKTKKNSDAFVLKRFFEALDQLGLREGFTLSGLAESVTFKEPRQMVKRDEPAVNFGALRAAKCLKTLDSTVMNILSNTDAAVQCAKKMRQLLNSPTKRNPIVKAYEAKASKLSKQEFWVDARLVPHKQGKEQNGQVRLSYKGVMKGVFDHVAKGQKLSNLRVARVLQVQGIDLNTLNDPEAQKKQLNEEISGFDRSKLRKVAPNLSSQTLQDEIKHFDRSRLRKTQPVKRSVPRQDLLHNIRNFDKTTLKTTYLQVTPSFLKKVQSFFEKTASKNGTPTLEEQKAAFLFFLSLASAKGAAASDKAFKTPVDPKRAPASGMSVVVEQVPEVLGGVGPQGGTPAERMGLTVVAPQEPKENKSRKSQAIVPVSSSRELVPFAPPKANPTPVQLTPEQIKIIFVLLVALQKNQMLMPEVKKTVRTIFERVEKNIIQGGPKAKAVLPPMEDSQGKRRSIEGVPENQLALVSVSKRKTPVTEKKRVLALTASEKQREALTPKRQLALPAPNKRLALPAPEQNVCDTSSLFEGLSLLRKNATSSYEKKRCANVLYQRVMSDFSDPSTLSADLLGYSEGQKESLLAFLKAIKDGNKPKSSDVLAVKKILAGEAAQDEDATSQKVVALRWRGDSQKEVPSKSASVEAKRTAEKRSGASTAKKRKLAPRMISTKKTRPEGLLKQRCEVKTPYELLRQVDFGDRACVMRAAAQWKNRAGLLGALYQRLSETRRDAVGAVIEARLKKAKTSFSGVGLSNDLTEKTFKGLLDALKSRPDGMLPSLKRFSKNACKSNLEESLTFASDARQGQKGKACLSQLIGLVDRKKEPETVLSNGEISLKARYDLLSDKLKGSVRQYLKDILPDTQISSQGKKQALEGLLAALTPKPSYAKRQQGDVGRSQSDEEDLDEEAFRMIQGCGKTLDQTLELLNADWAPQEAKQLCAQNALAVLSKRELTPFYKELGTFGTQGTDAQKKNVETFLQTLQKINSGTRVDFVHNPTL